MRHRSLAEALPDFSRAPVAAFAPKPSRLQPAPIVPQTSDAEWQARLDEAVAEAEARVTTKLQSHHAAELETLAETHSAELKTASQDFAVAMGEAIATRFAELEGRLTELTTASAARLLSGVLSDDLRTRSVARMKDVLQTALEDAEAVKITVRGPAALYEPLRAAMGDEADRMRFIEAPTADISVQIDETVYETRLAEWSGALTEALS
ncbi:hypothetical protein [Aliihoeflea sp. PC F10.4]